eukprot:6182682-Pleurochrysis_carterae.AAC.2
MKHFASREASSQPGRSNEIATSGNLATRSLRHSRIALAAIKDTSRKCSAFPFSYLLYSLVAKFPSRGQLGTMPR